MEFTNRNSTTPWSLRQFAIYHKYTPVEDNPGSTWILLGMWQRARDVLKSNAADGKDTTKMHPFELHLSFIDVAVSSWREYLMHLESQVEKTVRRAMPLFIL